MGPAPADPELTAEYLAELAERAYSRNPNLPNPLLEGDETEIDLGPFSEAGDRGSDLPRLEFEND